MTKEIDFSAGASLAGYVFQCRLALLRGLHGAKKKANGHISIEKFDDVAFEGDDLGKCLIQAKHHITPKNLSDNSVDVWKTLRVWIESLSQGVVMLSSTNFFLITTAVAPNGSAMSFLRVGATEEDREKAYTLLLKASSESSNKTTETARRAFRDLTKEAALALLRQIDVIDKHPNLADVMSEIEGELVLLAPDHPELAAQHLEGWWFNVVAKCLVNEGNARIPVQHIISKAHEIGRQYSGKSLPLDDLADLGAKSYSEDDEGLLLVRQMRVVGLLDRVVERGVEDYYRAYAQRSKWARDRLLLDDELSNYDEKLQDRWQRKFDEEVSLASSASELENQKVGKKICLWASQESMPLRTIAETWITSGSYQGLSDRLEIGWHPEFESIFAEDRDDDSSE